VTADFDELPALEAAFVCSLDSQAPKFSLLLCQALLKGKDVEHTLAVPLPHGAFVGRPRLPRLAPEPLDGRLECIACPLRFG